MEVREGYKKTEVGVIPEDWIVQNILDNFTLKARIGWQGLTTEEYLEQGEFYLVTGTDFIDGLIQWSTCHFVDETRYSQDKNIQLRIGDVLVTKDGTIGKVAFIKDLPGPSTLNSGVFVIRPKGNSYIPLFFFYVLTSNYFISFLNQLKAGSTISHLYQKDFVNFNFVTPPNEEEQTAIATALRDADALINSLEKLIAKKRNIKQGAMQELLTGKKRLPRFSGEWEVKKLGDVVEIVSGGTPKTSVAKNWDGGIKWCIPTDITGTAGKYLYETERTISAAGLNSCSATLLPQGALLLCSRATIGEVKIAGSEICTNQGFKSLICGKEVYNEFLYYLLLTMKPKMVEKAIGSTFLEISKKDAASLEVLLPRLDEQQAIATVLSDMDAAIAVLEQKRDKTRALKQGMIQELLTGKTRLI